MTSTSDSQPSPTPREFLLSRLQVALLFLIAILGAVALHDAFSTYVFEDAYITYRYAANVAEGAGYVFTPGERVFGATAPLHTLTLALCGFLGADIPTSAGILFVGCLAAVSVIGGFILRYLKSPNAGLLFALLVVAGSTEIYRYWGLETPMLAALILGSIFAALKGKDDLAGVLAGVAFLTRYDAALFAIILFAGLLVCRRRIPWRPGIIATVIVTPWLLFAWRYFGSVLPNTLAAKQGDVGIRQYLAETGATQLSLIWEPLRILESPLFHSPQLYLALNIALGVALLWACVRLMRKELLLGLLVLYPFALWGGYAVIGPPPAFRWYLVPAVFVLLVMSFAGFGAMVPEARFRVARFVATLSFSVATLLVIPGALVREGEMYVTSGQYVGRVIAYAEIAEWITEKEMTDLTLLTVEPGYLTYQTRNPVIDGAGLVTKGVFFHGEKSKRTGLSQLIRERKPPLVVARHSWWTPGMALTYSAFPGRNLHVSSAAHSERYSRLKRDFESVSTLDGNDEVLRHPFHLDLDRNSQPAWDSLGGRTPRFGRQRELTVDGEPVTESVLVIDQPSSGACTPPFLIDFDRLSFRVTATDPRATAVQLLIKGRVVLERTGNFKKGPRKFLLESWPVGYWKGQTAQLRFVNTGVPRQWVAVDHIRSVVSTDEIEMDRFDVPGGYSDRWEKTFPGELLDLSELAKETGVEFGYSTGAATTRGVSGKHELISKPFVVERDRLSFLLLDFCPSKSSLVRLLVDGKPARTFRPKGNGRIRPVTWDVREFRGREAVLYVADENDRPLAWIGIDEIVMTDE